MFNEYVYESSGQSEAQKNINTWREFSNKIYHKWPNRTWLMINQDRSCPKNVEDAVYFECLFTFLVILWFFSN